MKYMTLGKTGIRVSRLCFGTLTMGPLQRDFSPEKGAELLIRAFDQGVNFLDTAELYGNYPHIALALAYKSDAVVCTKCYAYDAKGAQSSWEKAVRGLGREYVDIFMLHEQESEHTLRGHGEALEFLAKKKEQGYIGALGMSTHRVSGVLAAAKHPLIEIVHPIFNMSGLGVSDGSAADMERAVEMCHKSGVGVFAMKPLGGGHLIARREQALAYVLEKPYIDCVAMGMQSIAEVDYNCALFSGAPLEGLAPTAGLEARSLTVSDWCEGCGACADACGQGAITVTGGKWSVDMEKCVFCGYCGAKCPQFCIKVI